MNQATVLRLSRLYLELAKVARQTENILMAQYAMGKAAGMLEVLSILSGYVDADEAIAHVHDMITTALTR